MHLRNKKIINRFGGTEEIKNVVLELKIYKIDDSKFVSNLNQTSVRLHSQLLFRVFLYSLDRTQIIKKNFFIE